MQNGLPFTILVVDDDEDDRLMINDAFLKIGFAAEVKKFIDGEALFGYLERIQPSLYPSLIVLDNSLPKLGADEILALLKANPMYKHIPVVIYTTFLSPSKKEHLLSLGAYSCYEKGNTMQEVIDLAGELKSLAGSNLEQNKNKD